MITTTSADGTTVLAADEGRGPAVLVLHPGSDDGRTWGKVAGLLAARFRVVRLHRRQYRLDLTAGSPFSIAQEVDDVLAVAKVTGEPVLLVGHSSGAVVALEALVASPSTFAGAVLYEPALVIGPPLGGEAVKQARAALAAGKPGRAMVIWLRDVIRLPRGLPGWAGHTWPSAPDIARSSRGSSTTATRSTNWASALTPTPGSRLRSSCSPAIAAPPISANGSTPSPAGCRTPKRW